MMIPTFDGSLSCWLIFGSVLASAVSVMIMAWRQQWVTVQLAAALCVGAVAIWPAWPSAAQDAMGAMARSIVDEAEARGRSAEAALADWAREAERRTDQYREEAQALAVQNTTRLQEGLRLVGADESVFGEAARLAGETGESDGAVYIAVSLGMPKQALQQLARDAEKAGAKLAIRGLVDGSFERTMLVARDVFGQDAQSGLAIDPQVFRAYGVESVPTFIVATSPVLPCDDGVDCVSVETPHDRIAGNISLAEALRQLAERGDAAPHVARAALARMEG